MTLQLRTALRALRLRYLRRRPAAIPRAPLLSERERLLPPRWVARPCTVITGGESWLRAA